MLQPKDFHCAAVTAFGEARGEGDAGMAMVVRSMMNRHAAHGHSGCSIANTAYDGYRKWKVKSPKVADPEAWQNAQMITLRVAMGEIDLGDCSDVTHFLNPSKMKRRPKWASRQNQICHVGNHVAYRVAQI
jgi:spore germination cell wall hydrolase CwlJ-like protein